MDLATYESRLKSLPHPVELLSPVIPIYKVSTSPNPTILIAAGIHGDERAGPLAILDYLERNQPTIPIAFFPLLNPYGFQNNTRKDQHGNDLNRQFFQTPIPHHNQIILDHLPTPKVFLSLHEDCDESRFYMYDDSTSVVLGHCLRTIAGTFFQLNHDPIIEKEYAVQAVIRGSKTVGSLEDVMVQRAVPYVICTETPMKAPLEQRIQAGVRFIETVISYWDR